MFFAQDGLEIRLIHIGQDWEMVKINEEIGL